MRHLWSLIAGVVIAPLAWALLAAGQPGSAETVAAWEQQDTIYTGDLLEPAAYVAVAGILLGLVATLRLSPAGPLVAGLVYLVPSVGLFVDPAPVRNAVPDDFTLAGQAFQLHAPLDNGTLLLLGLLLVVAAASVQRWRRWPAAVTEPEPADAETEAPHELDEASEPAADAPVRTAGYADTTDRLSPTTGPSAPSSAPPSWPPKEPAERAGVAPAAESPWAAPPQRRDETL